MAAFVLNGAREMVDEARARALVEESLAGLGHERAACRRIRLSNKSLSEEAAMVVAETLATFEQLEEADLSDIIAGRHEVEALKVLEIICTSLAGRTFKSIDLSDNALGEKGINACRRALEGQQELEQFFVNNNGLSASAAHAIVEILTFRTPTKLRVLHFFNNMSGDGGAEALASLLPHCPVLHDLRFSGTRAGKAGSLVFARALCDAAASNGTLRGLIKVDLSDNNFGGEAAELLARALGCQSNLVELNLRDSGLGDEGAVAVVQALASGTAERALERLDLSGNDITADGLSALSKALAKLPGLIYLGLEENEIGSSGCRRLSKALRRLKHLTHLKLSQNEITTAGALTVVRALDGCPALKLLELNANAISGEGLEEIGTILADRGQAGVLGPLDDNDEEGESEEEEDEGEDVDEGAEDDNKENDSNVASNGRSKSAAEDLDVLTDRIATVHI